MSYAILGGLKHQQGRGTGSFLMKRFVSLGSFLIAEPENFSYTSKPLILFASSQATLMQRSISVHRLNTFRHLLTDGATNEISRFDVISSNVEFKLSDSNVSIHFTNYNKFVESTESGASIRQENMFFVPNFGAYAERFRSWILMKLFTLRQITREIVASKGDYAKLSGVEERLQE
ncbi:hypothetical protein HID58_081434 [Brassica napus]|uniref:Uncharacterized protein n=1 Tax=Brassica napus TaxID=3708 RepID=A0ABQ7YAC2_BRANA|nr:hypothetical protein HID58_081434 [Brassica napus]